MVKPRQRSLRPELEEAVRCPLLERDLEGWVRCCTCRFFPLARRVAGDDDAHDALQQSWVIVLEKLHQYRGESPACGWVGAIVRHEAVHVGAARGPAVAPETPPDGAGSSARGRREQEAGVWASPEAGTYTRELTRLLLEIVDELPPTYRDVIRLREVEDRPTDEVARRLHISAQNVRVRLHRAHQLLRPRILRRLSASAAVPRGGGQP